MTTLLKGETARIPVRFKPSVVLPSAPSWVLYDWNDQPLQSGLATRLNSTTWQAEITIPSSLPVPDGAQAVQLEFEATDTANQDYTISKEITLVDSFDEHRPYGLLWWSSYTALQDTVLLPRPPVKLTVSLREGSGLGTVLATSTTDKPQPSATTERGGVYPISLSGLTMKTAASGGFYPYQLIIEADYGVSGSNPDVIVKPVYGMTPIVATRVNSLKRYLDKGQFTDLDPNLQWADEELVHYLLEGMQYVNSAAPSATYWTVDNAPSSMDSMIGMAGAWIALNARYIAEGMSQFDYSGANVSLTFDRRDTFATKMQELKDTLDSGLPGAKRAAVAVAGTGNGPQRSIGSLGVNIGPMINTGIRYGRGRGFV